MNRIMWEGAVWLLMVGMSLLMIHNYLKVLPTITAATSAPRHGPR